MGQWLHDKNAKVGHMLQKVVLIERCSYIYIIYTRHWCFGQTHMSQQVVELAKGEGMQGLESRYSVLVRCLKCMYRNVDSYCIN